MQGNVEACLTRSDEPLWLGKPESAVGDMLS